MARRMAHQSQSRPMQGTAVDGYQTIHELGKTGMGAI